MKSAFLGFFPIKELSDIEEKKSILLFGLPYEKIKTTPGGSKKAPDALRKQSKEFSGISSHFNIVEGKTNYFDYGNIHPIEVKNEIKKIWEKANELNLRLLVLGGDHSITYDTLSQAPWNEKTAVIWLDAHADLADEYPPGTSYSHGTVFTNLKKDNNLSGNQMLLIGGHAYTQTKEEFYKLKKKEVTFIPMYQFFENKEKCMKTIREFLKDKDKVFLSLDMDSMDQVYVPTLGTAEPFGLTPYLLVEILKLILPKTSYVDIVETQFKITNRIVLNFVVGLIFKILEIWEHNDIG
jgi:arginase family enzyme